MHMQQKETRKSNDRLLQWHPAFFAGIQIEFGEEAQYLEFKQEYLIGTKPMMIDVLIKKEVEHQLQKSIGKIFRKYNIIEYKSPGDYLSVDDFYKVHAYTYFYKADRTPVNSIKIEELSISLVSESYPQKLIQHLKNERNLQVKEMYPGIYYVLGTTLPVQIVVTSQLSETESLWLKNLTNRVNSITTVEKLIKDYQYHKKNALYESVMDIIVRANEEKFEEARKMCKALEELMKDELDAKRAEGEAKGKELGKEIGENRVNTLILKLSELGRTDDIIKAASDKEYQEHLFKEFCL